MISSHTVSIYIGPCQRATTQEECETFARQLGLTDTTATVIYDLERIPYCYYKPLNSIGDRRLFFNTAVTGFQVYLDIYFRLWTVQSMRNTKHVSVHSTMV